MAPEVGQAEGDVARFILCRETRNLPRYGIGSVFVQEPQQRQERSFA
jgi:hypothetical protein